MMDVDKRWHLASSAEGIEITEFELLLWRIHYGFNRWQEICEKAANQDELSADGLAVLHIIRMQEQPKTIADISRLLNLDHTHVINYNIAKLIKMGLIEKAKMAGKRQYPCHYTVTEKGIKNTDAYAQARHQLMINEFARELKNIDFEGISSGLIRMKSVYEEAARLASSYKLTNNKNKN